MDSCLLRGSCFRATSLQSFAEYRVNEAKNTSQDSLCSLDTTGQLLEYETLELRVHPPEVCIDNQTYEDRTVLTIDSANRPGTLVEVVQCLTELGLNIQRARISSDGGWFIDEFYITEAGGGRVTDSKKLAVMDKVLSVHYEAESAFAFENVDKSVTLVELSGPDRVGILAEIMELLTVQGCEVRSAAVWTFRKRVAIVMSVTEGGVLVVDKKLEKMKFLLAEKISPTCPNQVHVRLSQVRGAVHYERRLHQLMLNEEEAAWDSHGHKAATPTAILTEAALGPPCSSKLAESVSSDSSMPSVLDLTLDDLDPEYRSPKFSAAQVVITECKMYKYWMVDIKCKDRHKLFFDTVCTLADLKYDVYHGSIDCENGIAHQVYYCRKRCGDHRWNDGEAAKLKHMLQVSIQRRFPKGLKVHVHEMDRHMLAKLTATFRDAGFCITRAMVRPYSGKGGHTFHLLDSEERPPDKRLVVEVCQTLGGRMIRDMDEVRNDFVVSPSDRSEGIHMVVNHPSLSSKGTFAFLFSPKYNFSCVHLSPAVSSASSFGDR